MQSLAVEDGGTETVMTTLYLVIGIAVALAIGVSLLFYLDKRDRKRGAVSYVNDTEVPHGPASTGTKPKKDAA